MECESRKSWVIALFKSTEVVQIKTRHRITQQAAGWGERSILLQQLKDCVQFDYQKRTNRTVGSKEGEMLRDLAER